MVQLPCPWHIQCQAGWTQDGLEQEFLLIRLPAGAVRLRTAPENVSPGSPKPDLKGELKPPDGLSGRQYSTPASKSGSGAGVECIYQLVCRLNISWVNILGVCKDEGNQKCTPWTLLCPNVLEAAPSEHTDGVGEHTTCHLPEHFRDSHSHVLGWDSIVIRKDGFVPAPSPSWEKDNLSLSGMWPFSCTWSIQGCLEKMRSDLRILTLERLFP